ncbi:uncharacterized protein MKK02DRAFT_32182 [Dioszegia hungarica]|uniref:Uncharacterized protein n=1 Tax=Dioszegia hungarica TaxID=4972 RepID=A0AA38LW69_9TREE|nr:uncharacterized protein MKK02DRAFT_32182 [Dioszegia hungarica]KAI9637303.1 hypothetical protein MKK02DRAFT_32182 [Dioszegia hungarica]
MTETASSTTLQTLPLEMLYTILNQAKDYKDLRSLLLTSKPLHPATNAAHHRHDIISLPASPTAKIRRFTFGNKSEGHGSPTRYLTVFTYGLAPTSEGTSCPVDLLDENESRARAGPRGKGVWDRYSDPKPKFTRVIVESTDQTRRPKIEAPTSDEVDADGSGSENNDVEFDELDYFLDCARERSYQHLGPVMSVFRSAVNGKIHVFASHAEGMAEATDSHSVTKDEPKAEDGAGHDVIIGCLDPKGSSYDGIMAAHILTNGWSDKGPFEDSCTVLYGSRVRAERDILKASSESAKLGLAAAGMISKFKERLVTDVQESLALNRWSPGVEPDGTLGDLATGIDARIRVVWLEEFLETPEGQLLSVHDAGWHNMLATMGAWKEDRITGA